MTNRLSKVVNKGKAKQKPVPVKIVSEASTLSDRPSPDMMKYRAQDALRTLAEAERIKKDKALMRAAKVEAKAQMKQLSNVCKR